MLPTLLLLGLVTLAHALDVVTPYTNKVIFSPPSNWPIPRTLYARSLLIAQDGADRNVLLATWENYSPQPPNVWFPVYRSTDLGQTWRPLSNITDTQNGWGLRYQPFLYELPTPIGSFPAGTIIAAGNSIPQDLSQTRIDVYASTDKGRTWKFVSHVASGGRANPVNGETPVWEPFFLTYQGQLVIYYSDQRDPSAHGQKLVHQVTTNLINWGPVVDDVADANPSDRPGMTTIAQLPNGKYILTYEYGGAPEINFAVYYRISDSPLTFASATGHNIKAATGQQTQSSPVVVWTPFGGTNGTIVVSANNSGGLWINGQLGAVGSPWTFVSTGAAAGYARDLLVLPTSQQIFIVGGGVLSGSANQVLASVVNLP
ncbi:Oligoxyloglucan reducing end-specific cellobiohydrolase [Marasmius fiardii PR-910]|nr:Oligoxyloglucan reducing end-specific cellobiohydrolase [Marasmius fiardii PR-910]